MRLNKTLPIGSQIRIIPFIALVGFVAVLVVGYASLTQMAESNRISVNSLAELQDLREIQRAVGEARIAEKDFLSSRDLADLARRDASIMAVRKHVIELRQRRQTVTEQQLNDLLTLLNSYSDKFEDMVREAKAIGLSETEGLRGRMRAAIHDVERRLQPYKATLSVNLLQMRRHEKDFLLRRDDKYFSLWQASVAEFRKKLETSYLIPATEKLSIERATDVYAQSFEELAKHVRDMMLDTANVDHASGQILEDVNTLFGASEQAARKEAQYALLTAVFNVRYLGLIIIIVGALTFLFARTVGKGITQPLVRLAHAMRSLAMGELRVELPAQDYKNEIGDMSKALGVFRDNEEARRDAVRELRRARSHMENVILSMREALFETDTEGCIILANHAAETMLCARPGSLAGQRLSDFFKNMADRNSDDNHLIRLQSGVEHLYSTDRNELYHILDNAPLPVLVVGADGKIRRANDTAAQALGYSPDDLPGLSIDILLSDDDIERHKQYFSDFARLPRPRTMGRDRELPVRMSDGSIVSMTVGLVPLRTKEELLTICVMRRPSIDPALDAIEDTPFGKLFSGIEVNEEVIAILQGADRVGAETQFMRTVDGREFPVEYSGELLRENDGVVTGAIVVVRDISERLRAEKEIRKFKATLDATGDAIFMFRTDTLKFIYLNDEARRQTGWSDGEYLDKTPSDINNIFEESRFRKLVAPLTEGTQSAVSVDTVGLDGYPIELKIELFDQGTEDERFVATIRDISERVAAQNSVAQYKQVLDQTKDMIYMFRPDTLEFFYGNQAAMQFSGVDEEGFARLSAADISPGFDPDAFRARTYPLIFGVEDALVYEGVHRDRDGHDVPVELTLQIIEPEGEEPRYVAVVRDITERKEAERRIMLFKQALDQSNDMIYMLDPDSLKFLYVNDAVCRFWERPFEDIVGRRASDIIPGFDPDVFRERIAPLHEEDRKAVLYETTHRRPDGTEVPVEIGLQVIQPEGRDPRYVAIVRDISERKEIERAKSEFVSTVSHELRTPLTSIKGSLDLIEAGAMGEVDPKIAALVGIARKNSERLVLLINDILDMEKLEAGKMEMRFDKVNIVEVLEEAAEANKAYADRLGVKIVLKKPRRPIYVNADYDRLMQVMANLLSNAAKFSNKGGKVEISTKVSKGKVRVSVKDHGSGIPEAAQATIFDKFTQADSSDHRQKGGTGLGLSITRLMIEAHGGKIDFVSKEGEGTTFFFELDLLQPQTAKASLDEGDHGEICSDEDMKYDHDLARSDEEVPHILVCEDDADISSLLRMILQNAGFRVTVAGTAAKARKLLAEQEFDAMTLDLGLPDMNGLAMLKEAEKDKLLDGVPVVVVSAQESGDPGKITGASAHVIDWIQKPIEDKHLIEILGSAVGQPGARKPHILHVEDDPHIREIVSSIIGDRARICTAASVKEARYKLGKKRFDLIILDMTMPDGSGAELLPLANIPPQDATPVLVFSAQEITEELVNQVSGVLVKSRASNEELLRMVDSVVTRKSRKDARPAAE